MRQVRLPDGEMVPALGVGTWQMAGRRRDRTEEIKALRLGLDLGMRLIDTAEMYGEGAVEELIAAAIEGRRDELFLVSKVHPQNASRKGVVAACERSLRRLRTGRIDLYLLHWRGSVPLAETVQGFGELQQAGKIRHWGVSNFDSDDLEQLWRLPVGAAAATNQVLYHLGERGIEWGLLPWSREHRLPTMAYSPLGQGAILGHRALKSVAQRHGATAAQIALAWLLRQGDIIAIPKAARPRHMEENVAALEITLDSDDLAALDAAFAPPRRGKPLAML